MSQPEAAAGSDARAGVPSETPEAASHPPRVSKGDWVCCGVVVAVTAAHVAYYFPRVVDDLFISLRFAENFAHGNGAVYNPGDRVEGYSSPLWMFLQSVGIFLGFEGVTWTKLLGCASLFGLEYALYLLSRRVFGIKGPLAFLPALCVATNSYVVNWAVLGLETPLHLLAIAAAPVAIEAALAASTRRSRGTATVAIIGLGLTRPESVLYLGANALAPFVRATSLARANGILRAVVRVFLPGALVLFALLLVRRGYYGSFVPNTYFVKGVTRAFDVNKLSALWDEGATTWEAATYLGGAALLLYFGFARRALAPALSVLACLYFTANVRLDWMPSLRHLLPVTVLTPVGFACLADAFARARQRPLRLLAWTPLVVPVLAFASVVTIDNRNSPEENRGRGWIRPKTLRKWEDTRLSYERLEPPHVSRMRSYEMGQITQAWHVLEASAEPVAESWYIGRDIGAVGYYTGVRVFDTAGLFTKEVSHSTAWTRDHRVPDDLIRTGMAKRPVAGEIYEGWETALGRDPDLLRGYRIRTGSMRSPFAFLAEDRRRPSAAEVLRRYEAMVAKFPKLYYLNTLYGESVGAVVERRLRIVKQQLSTGRL